MAAVISVAGDSIQIDKGLTDGLRAGDRGQVFYELVVSGETKRVDVGHTEVFSVLSSTALISRPEGKSVRTGFRVEFEIDGERLSPGAAVAAQPRLGPMLHVAAGSYTIGLDSNDAKFYNESPQFEKRLEEFWIQPAPAEAIALHFEEAQAYCQARGGRLPTEYEWEAASRHPAFEVQAHYEWTASWYLPHPGNKRPERAYGERFRAVRGSPDLEAFRPQERRYFDAGKTSSEVGFRCASDEASR